MSVRLETRSLTKTFGTFTAVNGVSLSFAPGQIHAVLGENGAGKSTLMKLLFGLHHPTSGEILIDGESVHWRSSMDAIRAGLGMVQQHFTLIENLSAIDNIMLGAEVEAYGKLNRKAAIARIEALLPNRDLAVSWLKPIQEMSVGEKQRVEILKLLFRESKILFLDEPTAVLTPAEIEEFFSVLRALKAQGRTIVLITHKINEVLAVCDTYTVLRQGKLITAGQVAGTSADQIVESMIGRKVRAFEFDRPSAAGHEVVLDCKDVDGIDLAVRAGEIVGIAGVEGSGQTGFVDSIIGIRGHEGEIRILGETVEACHPRAVRDLGVGLIPEDRHEQGLWLDHSCHDNMIIGLEDQFLRNEVFQRNAIVSTTGDWAKEYDVRAANLHVPVGSLSGGNQQKVIFAREVSGRKPRFLICHQPTRGVDLGAIDLIHRKMMELRNEGLGLLVLSSELDELLKLCDRIVVFFDGRITGRFERAQFDAMKIGAAMTGVPVEGGAQ